MLPHIAILLSNTLNKKTIIQSVLKKNMLRDIVAIEQSKTALFSSVTVDKFIGEEFLHDKIIVNSDENTSLSSMSSGQQKKALLQYQIRQQPDIMVLDDVYSNVDIATQKYIREQFIELSDKITVIQLAFRKSDILPFIGRVLVMQSESEFTMVDTATLLAGNSTGNAFKITVPVTNAAFSQLPDPLIDLQNITVSYEDKAVLDNLSWQIRKGEFWQLAGPNGSGKSTLVSMICGDNPKAYGQNMTLFGRKKGSGETIWEIKEKIGYFTTNMTLRFTRHETVENMIISGLNDSVGLYKVPTDLQMDLAREWVKILGKNFAGKNFQQLSIGQQRMVMVARAMVKQPPLLILDEPTIELDEENTALFIGMVHAIAALKQVAIIYISHRDEPALQPERIFELVKTGRGFTGKVSSFAARSVGDSIGSL